MTESRPPSNTTTELARERSRAAAERTLTSWIGGCMTLIALGAALAERAEATLWFSLTAIALGITFLLLAMAVHRREIEAIERPEGAAYASPFALATTAVICFGVIIFAGAVLNARW